MRFRVMEAEQKKKLGSARKQNTKAAAPVGLSSPSQLHTQFMAAQAGLGNRYVQRMVARIKEGQTNPEDTQGGKRENRTALPEQLKLGVESLSGFLLDDVRVHYNSPKPAELQALAFTQGTEIYIAPGQERHLPHEAWHVVQQAQGRVKPTRQLQEGALVNDEKTLESEADFMGMKANSRWKFVPAESDELESHEEFHLQKRSAPLNPTSIEIVIQRTIWSWIDGQWKIQEETDLQTPPPNRPGKYPYETLDTGSKAETPPLVDSRPPGYSLITVGKETAYVKNTNRYDLGDLALVHIVEVATNVREAHQSKKMEGTKVPTYVHPSDHELYTVTKDGEHSDGIPMITVHEQGKVRDGIHKFHK